MDVKTKRRNNNRENNVQQGLINGFVNNSSKNQPEAEGIKRCECGTSNGLHHFNCLPNHLQYNRFVHTGYRVNMSTWQCFKSLLYFHNESFNVYSHGKKSYDRVGGERVNTINYLKVQCCVCILSVVNYQDFSKKTILVSIKVRHSKL